MFTKTSKKIFLHSILISIILGFSFGCKSYKTKSSVAGMPGDVYSVLSAKCFACHAGGNEEGDFGTIDNVSLLISNGYISPGSPESSTLYAKITSPISGAKMPFGGPYLSESEVATIYSWIAAMTATSGACVRLDNGQSYSFSADIAPIFQQSLRNNGTAESSSMGSCIHCHRSGGNANTKLWFKASSTTTNTLEYNTLFSCLSSTGNSCAPYNGPMVVAGDPCASRLYRRITQSTSPTEFTAAEATEWNLMPKGIGTGATSRRALTTEEKTKIFNWIKQGAPNN